MCRGKEQFKKRDAEVALKRVKKSSKQYRKECRMYYCQDCHTWHLTSQEEFEPEILDIVPIFGNNWDKLLQNFVS